MDYNKVDTKPLDDEVVDDAKETALPPAEKFQGDILETESEESKVPVKKKSLIDRFVDLFVGSNGVKAAAKTVYSETIKPAMFDMAVNYIEDIIETVAYGTAANRNRYPRRNGGIASSSNSRTAQTPYHGMYNQGTGTGVRKAMNASPSRGREVDQPWYPERRQCEAFIDVLGSYIHDKGYVTVNEFYKAAQWESAPMDRLWGWRSVNCFHIQRDNVNGGYIVNTELAQMINKED